jgi:hypothetical protein
VMSPGASHRADLQPNFWNFWCSEEQSLRE